MKKYVSIALFVTLLVVVGIFSYISEKKVALRVLPEARASVLTYVNSDLGYSVEYPSSWVADTYTPDALNNDVRIRPSTPEMVLGMPADYVHIRLENTTLDKARQLAASQVAGNDMVESTAVFAGKAAYFYSHPDYPSNQSETSPSIVFRGIILEHNGKVISIYTHKYQMSEVQQVLSSFKFN